MDISRNAPHNMYRLCVCNMHSAYSTYTMVVDACALCMCLRLNFSFSFSLRDACAEISAFRRYLVEAIKLSEMGMMCSFCTVCIVYCVWHTQEHNFYQYVAMATIPRVTMCHVSPIVMAIGFVCVGCQRQLCLAIQAASFS